MKKGLIVVCLCMLSALSVLALADDMYGGNYWSIRGQTGSRSTADWLHLNTYALSRYTETRESCQSQGSIIGRDNGTWVSVDWKTRDCADFNIDTATKTQLKVQGRFIEGRQFVYKPITVTYYIPQNKVTVTGSGMNYVITDVNRLR